MLVSFKKFKANGEIVSGISEFGNLKEAESKLLESGELLIELKSVAKSRKYKLQSQDILDFTSQLHQLIHAGLPVYESLQSLEEKKPKYHFLLKEISEDIKEGHSFSSAIKNQSDSFNSIYTSIIQASEAAGELKEGLSSLKGLLEKQAKIKKTLKSAFIYPSILLVFSFLIVNVLLLFIIPSLRELFEGRSVNSLTSLVLSISKFYCKNFIFILGFYFISVFAFIYCYKQGLITSLFMRLFHKIRFCHDLLISIKLENFFSCLGLLLIRGINLKDALVLSKNVVTYPDLESHIDNIIQEILRGKKFSEVMDAPFPYVAQRLIALSELTGQMGSSCVMLTEIFHETVEKKLQILATLLQPLLLALIGLIIGIVVLSILLPLTDVGGFL